MKCDLLLSKSYIRADLFRFTLKVNENAVISPDFPNLLPFFEGILQTHLTEMHAFTHFYNIFDVRKWRYTV